MHGSLIQLNRLTSWVAHEVNNSLGGIHTSFALLQRLIPTDHPHYRYVAAVEREISRSSALTARLQHSYEFDQGRLESITLPAALAEAVRALTPLSHDRNVSVTIEQQAGGDNAPRCTPLVRAAIRHLLQHAIESAEPGARLLVRGSSEPGRLTVTVPTWNTDSSLGKSPLAGPPGLALSLVRDLVRALDGELILDGPDGEEGTLQLSLPVHAVAEVFECRSKE